MSHLATIENGIVANIIVGDPAQFPDLLDLTGMDPQPGIGWTYDGATFTAPEAPPAPEPAPVVKTKYTPFEFRQLFTLTERGGISIAGDTDPEVRAVVDDLYAAQEIDLTSNATVGALILLTSKGLLTEQRKDAILNGETPPV